MSFSLLTRLPEFLICKWLIVSRICWNFCCNFHQSMEMQIIISGTGSAFHRLTKGIAKILTPLLGTISQSHIKNSSNLVDKLKDIWQINSWLV